MREALLPLLLGAEGEREEGRHSFAVAVPAGSGHEEDEAVEGGEASVLSGRGDWEGTSEQPRRQRQ